MNILLIDDHTLFRSGVEIMLNKLEPKTIIQSYDNYSNAAHTVTNPTDINLILLDYHIPGSSAVSNIENTRKTFENAKLVILSSENEPIKIVSTIDSGAAGFISKSSKPEILIAALKLVLAGGVYLPPEVLKYQASSTSKTDHTINDGNPLKNLSNKQMTVFKHMIDGKNNKTIAKELNLSLGTIKAHLSAAYQMLGVSSRTEAVVLASKLLNKNETKH